MGDLFWISTESTPRSKVDDLRRSHDPVDAAADRAFLAEGLGFPAVVAEPDGCCCAFSAIWASAQSDQETT
jgi:hypothetical protein